MASDLLLDTHVWIWTTLDQPKISSRVRNQLTEAALDNRSHVAAISLYEVADLTVRRRIELGVSLPEWMAFFFEEPFLRLVPLTPEVALQSTLLPRQFHGDPGDRLIAATAIVHNMALCTHDHALLRFGKQGTYRFLEA